MESTTPDREDLPADPLPSLPMRVLLVLVSPHALFRGLVREPTAWGAIALGALFVATGNVLIPEGIWEETMRRQAMEMGTEMPGGEGMAGRIAKIAAVFGSVIAWPLLALLFAGFYTLLFRAGMGYGGRFGQYLAVAAHALLVPAIGVLLLLPLRVHTGDPQLSLTLGLLVPVAEEGFLHAFLQLQDLFNLWAYALVGVGAAAIGERESIGAPVAAAVGAAVLISLLLAALTF